MKRAKLWLLGACAAGAMLACGGVTQPLGDTDGGGGGQAGTQLGGEAGTKASPPTNQGGYAGTTTMTTTTSHQCETECVQKVFTGMAASCKLCHGNAFQAAGLDLQSPNVTSRLKDVPATHGDRAPQESGPCPIGDKLIDSASPEDSWLLKKLRGLQGNCGTAMPQTPPMLTPEEQQCMTTYVACVAAE